ncbi:helix-turn-helix transcriptional regulator [Selenomonas artemidis]|uniref:helix-turn-helix transcriptional regulator n=1 Tax=Selenomonas artemidis TaxID=671224 RepID=UPI0023F21A5B|nr:helix-turn-helix domain-containing protein [Selenomonas artemidis]
MKTKKEAKETAEKPQVVVKDVRFIQPELLEKQDVAAMLSVSVVTVDRLIQEGKIPFYLLWGGFKRYKRADVMDYIASLPQGEPEQKLRAVRSA